eukprot:766843-Hanusia_phi.AAC.2
MKYDKIKSEMSRLQTWLRKHQDESVADGRYAQFSTFRMSNNLFWHWTTTSKQELLTTIQLYYKAAITDPEPLRDAAFALVDDLLKLPEGKLVMLS